MPARRRRRSGRRARSPAARRSGSPSGRSVLRRTRSPSISISTVTVGRSWPGTSEHASLDSAVGSIGSTAPGHVHARPAPVRLAVDQRSRTHVRRHVGDVNPDSRRAVVLGDRRDRVVEVARGNRVDRERRQRTQVAPAGPVQRLAGRVKPRQVSDLVLDGRVEPAAQSAIDHQRLDHVARHVRATQTAGDRRTPGAAPVSRRCPG